MNTLSNALRKLQEFNGLEITGRVDEQTKNLIQTPRCGVDDRVADFATSERKWKKRYLTYRIFSYPTNGLRKETVDIETEKAFSMWQEVSNMKFHKQSFGPVDIEIHFLKRAHRDRYPFDGPGRILAHAFFPWNGGKRDGDAHFDDEESWSVTPGVGIQLLNTLIHEFGHSIGLDHSRVPGAIMAPRYKGWDTNLRLTNDDIAGIQFLYGEPDGERPVVTPTGTTEDLRRDNELCQSGIDAIIHVYGGTSYVFRGGNYYKLIDTKIAPGYPKTISENWPGLPNNIDAAVTWRAKDVTYFFKGDRYWRFKGQNMKAEAEYPKPFSNWPGLPEKLDAVFEWGSNNDLYFFKGSQYWKYDTGVQTMDQTYPRDLSVWKGVPTDIDAAFQWENGVTYFFKAGRYWRFHDSSVSVQQATPPYPRDAGEWWFGCPAETLPPIPRHPDMGYGADKDP